MAIEGPKIGRARQEMYTSMKPGPLSAASATPASGLALLVTARSGGSKLQGSYRNGYLTV